MKKTQLLFLTIIAFLFTAIVSEETFSQENISFGKIDMNDLTLTKCSFDTAADAMVLGDIGSTWFEYDAREGFVMIFDRLVRIKIFTKNGYSAANWSISLYHNDQEKETVSAFKARTYNLEGGKIAETKVKDESVFTEEEDSYHQNTRFTFPALKEGSVIELKYTIRSPFFRNLRDWSFQWQIPVKWSQYEVRIPEYFHYSRHTFGFIPFLRNEESLAPNPNNDASFNDNVQLMAIKDVPALREEPYVTCMGNYTTRMEFVLHSYWFPGHSVVEVNSSWDKIADDLLKDEDFGSQLKKGKVVADLALTINAAAKTPAEKMQMAFGNIRNRMKWNEHYSKYTSKKLSRVFEEKSGNSADINLLLIVLMKELGLKSDPVMLSTREHGLVMEQNPFLSHMNHVICLVTIDSVQYLLDATQRLLPYTMLPFQDLNGRGMVVLPGKVSWINLMKNEKNSKLLYATLKLTPSGEITGSMKFSQAGYVARDIRNSCVREGRDEYLKTLKKNLKGWELTDISLENLDNPLESLITGFSLQNSDIAQVNGNMIYLNVLANLGQTVNEFVQEKRTLPVDFGCPLKESYVFNYEIPEGFSVESLPENVRLLLPDQAGSYKFMIQAAGNTISVNAQLSVSKTLFLPGDYEVLRNFFTQVMAKQSQQIVLKKS